MILHYFEGFDNQDIVEDDPLHDWANVYCISNQKKIDPNRPLSEQ